jgi:hypothetical protein
MIKEKRAIYLILECLLGDKEILLDNGKMKETHFVEMPKLILAWKAEELDPWNDVLARWFLLLGVVNRRNHEAYEDILKELKRLERLKKK